MIEPFQNLEQGAYDLIVADPPWAFRTWSESNQQKSASRHYSLMTTEDIKRLPVESLATKDCLLMLWTTGAMLEHGLQTLNSWGFTYKSLMSWRKLTKNGKVRMGTGYWTRSMHEPILLGTRGNPKKLGFPSLFDGVAREHSRKPEEFYDIVIRKTPDSRRLDLFSRANRLGFDSWGNEAGKFDV